MDLYTLHFDGSCGPTNPGGTAAYGFHLDLNGQTLDSGHGVIGTGEGMSNNLAEYVAFSKGLESFLQHYGGTPAHLAIRGDSNLVVQQMNGVWKAHENKLYYSAYLRAKDRLTRAKGVLVAISIKWIPREQNTICDELSKAHQTAD